MTGSLYERVASLVVSAGSPSSCPLLSTLRATSDAYILIIFWHDDPLDFYYGFGGGFGVNRRGFAAVSQRARDARAAAESIFLEYLAAADTSKGSATEEIIQFHMVPDMRKAFSRFFREHSCKATSRQVTRAEQDKINPTRKSLMWYTSVTVTPAAQKAYVEEYPAKVEEFKKRREAVLAARNARNASASKTAATQDQPAASDSELKCTATEQPQPSVTQIKKVKA